MTSTGRSISVLVFSCALTACAGTGSVGVATDGANIPMAAESDSTAPDQEDVVEVATSREDYRGDEVICRREQTAGTHMRRRLCWTRAQRTAIREESQRVYRELKGFD